MDGAMSPRGDQDLGGAPEGLDALTVAERLKADGGVGLFVARDYARMGEFTQAFGFFAGDIEGETVFLDFQQDGSLDLASGDLASGDLATS